jgi:hypothetical protein
MTKKIRLPIPDDVAAEILFLSDRTCCVCTIRGKQVQIHHIDENPANNLIDNLAVLCFECHNQTQIKGGFGRKLEEHQIVKYRGDWINRVKERKQKADELASIQTVTGSTETVNVTGSFELDYLDYKTHDSPDLLKDYLEKILVVHQAQLTIAKTKWDKGVTAFMNQGNYDMIDFYQEVLIELSTFYPKGHFNVSPEKYFNELISSKFMWYRLVLEPEGAGTGGTIISTMTGGYVADDIKKMIVDMVTSLLSSYALERQVDLKTWIDDWLNYQY